MNKKYQIIYADPPWRYTDAVPNRRVENKYPTMALDDIKALKVPADKNCLLYMWTTAPKLEEALEVIQSWGFKYKTCAVWDKEIIGMGYWFRGQHELLLVGVKGKFSPPKQEIRVSSMLREKRGEHSSKPNYIRTLISEWYPKCSKLELFARKNEESLFTPNSIPWDVWGNEVESDIELK